MKLSNKIVALLLALSLLTALAACGSNPPEDVTPSDEIGDISSTHAPEETPEATEKPEVSETPEPTAEPTPEPTQAPVKPTEPPVQPTEQPVATEPPVESSDEPSGESVDLSAFFSTISSTYEFASLTDLNSEMLDGYYPGLTAISTLQLIAKAPMITASTVTRSRFCTAIPVQPNSLISRYSRSLPSRRAVCSSLRYSFLVSSGCSYASARSWRTSCRSLRPQNAR